ncbi:small-conductance mechanosensitive channel [Rhodococcus sp. 27YEA15]|uniref:mechanosensitive ion channel family protein n=1 Tax=Rhodococcus sp. 27YEA15 TaxID=3156259 RepID=UPI003C7E8FEF
MISDVYAWELTETNRDWLIHRPIEIAVYTVLAVVLRFVLHRMIDRMSNRRRSTDTAVNERRSQRTRTIGSVLKSTVSIAVLTWCVLQILGILGINVAPFIASAGVVGLAIGFGAQNLVRDFLSGIFMLLEDQYGVGDVVDLGDAVGTVETVGLRVTTVRDANGTLWYCRNGEILRVGNMSQGYANAVLDLPVAHNANVHKACEVATRAVLDAAASAEIRADVIDTPEMLGVNSVTAESITIRITAQVKPGRQWAVQRAFARSVLSAFEKHGIEAPYLPSPHRSTISPTADISR